MRNSILFSFTTLVLTVCCSARTTTSVVDDHKIATSLTVGIGKLVEAGGIPTSKDLIKQLGRKKCQIQLPIESNKKPVSVYESSLHGVVAISSVYKCDKCTKWHKGGGATAWVLTSDGIMVTNYHVFKGKDVAGFGIRTFDGRVAPVVEILAGSERDDVVIFRVKGKGYKPLALGPDALVGIAIHIIAHPDSRYYSYTAGNVSRYYKKRIGNRNGATAMTVTAEFARGSSGGPVMDDFGNVVGMVASTHSLYTSKNLKDPKRSFQMVIRNCVPVSAIRALLEKPIK